MAFPSLERCVEQSLEPLSARGAGGEAVASAQPRRRGPGRDQHKKPTSGALEEIAAAKVEYRVKEEGDTPQGLSRT